MFVFFGDFESVLRADQILDEGSKGFFLKPLSEKHRLLHVGCLKELADCPYGVLVAGSPKIVCNDLSFAVKREV